MPLPFDNPLLRLILGYQAYGAPRHTDEQGLASLWQNDTDALARQNAGAFRNVGPKNLTEFPDRNGLQPDDAMTYRMFPQFFREGG